MEGDRQAGRQAERYSIQWLNRHTTEEALLNVLKYQITGHFNKWISSHLKQWISSHFKQCHFKNVNISYITHLICVYWYILVYTIPYTIYCTLPMPLGPSLIHIFICTYSYSFLHTCVLKVVDVKLLDYLLDITAWSELEAQAFRYTCIYIC